MPYLPIMYGDELKSNACLDLGSISSNIKQTRESSFLEHLQRPLHDRPRLEPTNGIYLPLFAGANGNGHPWLIEGDSQVRNFPGLSDQFIAPNPVAHCVKDGVEFIAYVPAHIPVQYHNQQKTAPVFVCQSCGSTVK